jgi:hypothetical protein
MMNLRVEIAYQARVREEYLRLRYGEDMTRVDVRLAPGHIVLVPLSATEERQLTVIAGGTKLVPKWSSPCRVISVKSEGKAAVVRNLVTGTVREVHLQHARLVTPPLTLQQQEEWRELMTNESSQLPSTFDPEIKAKVLAQSFQELGLKRLTPDNAFGGADNGASKRKASSGALVAP